MAAALDLFVAQGYAGTRLDDVAAHAGVSKGTLYLYFDTKEALFKAVVRENIVRSLLQARALAERYPGRTDALLHELIHSLWRNVGDTQASGIVKLMMAESGNFPEIARFYFDEVIQPAHEMIEHVIERGIRRGEFRPVAVGSYMRVMVAPIVMLMLWRHSFGPCCNDSINVPEYLQALIDMSLAGLRPPPRVVQQGRTAKTRAVPSIAARARAVTAVPSVTKRTKRGAKRTPASGRDW